MSFGSDLRHATRSLAHRPGHSIALVLTVAVGIAASTAVFSIVDTVMLRPLSYPNPSALVALWQSRATSAGRGPAAPADLLDWTEDAQSFSSAGLWAGDLFTVAASGDGERVQGMRVSGDFFATLGAAAAVGRTFTAEDEDAPSQVVLSHALWLRAFGADEAVVGSVVQLNNDPFTVAGVMPPGFSFPELVLGDDRVSPEVYVPLSLPPFMRSERGAQFMGAFARLKPGVSVESAQEEASIIAARLAESFPQTNAGRGALVVPLRDEVVGDLRLPLAVLLSAALMLLLIACCNAAGMLITRGLDRTADLGVRVALGATRARLWFHVMADGALLFVLGGGLAMLLVPWLQRALLALDPSFLPRMQELSVDERVVGFGLGASLVTALVFGVMPLAQALSADVTAALHHVRRGATDSRLVRLLRNGLVASQIALGFVLLIAASLMTRSMLNLGEVELGFDARDAVTFEIALPPSQYRRDESPAVFAAILERVRAVPGVEAAGAINLAPLNGMSLTWPFLIENRPAPPGSGARVDYRVVSDDALRALDVRLVDGRMIAAADDAGSAPVALVNEALAREYWPGESPLGRRIRLGGDISLYPWATVIGVVGDVRGASVDAPAPPAIYRPMAQHPYLDTTIVLRARERADDVMAAIRAELRAYDSSLRLHNIQTLGDSVSRSNAFRESLLAIVAAFAGAALFLLAIGVYGAVSNVAARRFGEMGIRMALGAQSRDVVWTVLRGNLVIVAVGLSLGILIALAAAPLFQRVLFEVSPTDSSVYVATAAVIALTGFVASYVPAWSMSRATALQALRHE
jgi:putative ABC transport system permease protein